MAKLRFKQEEGGKPSKEAISMYSKDGEMVDFSKPRLCVGQVETWLSLLLETMQETIKHEFQEAVVTYEEKPREQWIFEPPAQVSLHIQWSICIRLLEIFILFFGCV